MYYKYLNQLLASLKGMSTFVFLILFFFISGCDFGEFKSIPNQTIIEIPKIIGVNLNSDKHIYGLGNSIEILINFDHPVVVKTSGERQPNITLIFKGLSRSAQYKSGSGTKTLLFQYIVVAEDGDSILVEMASSISLNGASISSRSGNKAILDLIPIKIGGIDATTPLFPSGLSLHSNTASLSNDPTPEIVISGVESLAIVQLFSDNACSITASNSKEVLENESTVTIEANTITAKGTVTYYARQTDPAGNGRNSHLLL